MTEPVPCPTCQGVGRIWVYRIDDQRYPKTCWRCKGSGCGDATTSAKPRPMKAPHFAAITVALDTQRYGARRPDERRETIFYLVDRLLAGEAVAESALEHYGLKVSVRPALGPEILEDKRLALLYLTYPPHLKSAMVSLIRRLSRVDLGDASIQSAGREQGREGVGADGISDHHHGSIQSAECHQ